MIDDRDIPVYHLLTELYRENKGIISNEKSVKLIAMIIIKSLAKASE